MLVSIDFFLYLFWFILKRFVLKKKVFFGSNYFTYRSFIAFIIFKLAYKYDYDSDNFKIIIKYSIHGTFTTAGCGNRKDISRS